MYPEITRGFVIMVIVACVVAMLLWARGPAHHHGQYVGSLGPAHTSGSLTTA
jgi:hypothetical protein